MLSTTVINSFKNLKILCIGDIMLDKFMYGDVERISPEAPVPVFKINREKVMLGGTGNVIANLSSLCVKTMFIGAAGNDESSVLLERYLKETGCEYSLIKPLNYTTTTKIRMIANNNHLIRADKEASLTFETLKYHNNRSLVKIKLETGRTHQIRVQFASRGYPIVGDHKYGSKDKQTNPMLYCYQLTFKHHDQVMTFTNYPPFSQHF